MIDVVLIAAQLRCCPAARARRSVQDFAPSRVNPQRLPSQEITARIRCPSLAFPVQ